MKKINLKIGGMSCSACSNGLEKYLNKQTGVISASVNLVMANALIEYDEGVLNRKKIEKFVKEAGFESLGLFDEFEKNSSPKMSKLWFVIMTALAVILMYISMGSMIGLPEIPFLAMHTHDKTFASSLLILTVPFLVYGFDIIKSGFKNLFHRTPNMDTLVTLGVLTSLIYSIFSVVMIFMGHHHYIHRLYFESAAIVIYFIKLGRYIDSVSKDKTKEAIQSLVQITPKDAVIKTAEGEKKVTIDEIQKGDTVICKPGERIAVDGTITFGKTHLDESFITGESKPAAKEIGAKVIAGSINYDGYIEYSAERIGKESTISEIVHIVTEASSAKIPLARIADRISSYFVPTIIGIAILSFVGYLAADQGFNAALNTFVTVLVVACPCSLGLATPLAIVVSEGRCAKNGILIKKGDVLETASKINKVIFDKTGTLTYGNLKISRVIDFGKMPEKDMMSLVCSTEAKSSHPISKAFAEYAKNNTLTLSEPEQFENIDGMGIHTVIGGKSYYFGNAKLLAKYGIENDRLDDANALADEGNTLVYVADEVQILSIIGINDIIRDNVDRLIRTLHSFHVEPIMLTGDNEQTAKKIAAQAGIKHVISGVLPAEKGNVIKELKAEGDKVMMIGDGINDSPALALSDIGVSVNSGSDIAMNSADVILMNDDLMKIPELIRTSRATVRNIKQNLFWAFFYNCLMIPIAIGALKHFNITINPMIASLAMTLSSFTVIINALRLRGSKK
ncbi:MAG TPA: heavy metal translocating P-type ATPase [Ruminococcaceae bacterium]|jgi:Cu+-exporting ATPase|nr:heavy metal translocating P-type ATPase [Oscillospiraceae bacterium]